MYHVNVNGTYIGNMVETAARNVALLMCIRAGDVATLVEDLPTSYYNTGNWDDWYSFDGPVLKEITMYHNGREVLTFEADDGAEIPSAHINHRLRTKGYRVALSRFKYNRSDARGEASFSAYIKRQMRRTERRVGKALTIEQMSEAT